MPRSAASPSKNNKKKSNRVSPNEVYCPKCDSYISARGYWKHNNACKGKKKAAPGLSDIMKELLAEEQKRVQDALMQAAEGAGIPHEGRPTNYGQSSRVTVEELDERLASESDIRPGSPMQEFANDLLGQVEMPSLDEIKIEYHPNSGRLDQHIQFDDFQPQSSHTSINIEIPVNKEPWLPFRTRLDFEIAEFIQGAHLNNRQTDDLLSLIQRCISDAKSYSITNSKDLKNIWELARERASGFVKTEVSIPYQQEERQYTVWTRQIWDWAKELLIDPHLISKFRWDAEKRYKFNGEKFVRFIDEPWTADAWWNVQSKLPAGTSPFCIIIYADKTQLSSFGTAKGYPVLARCANLPIELRNSDGIGGARLVGWLPIVKEDAGETGKKGFINLKRVVWHEAFYEILKSMQDWAKTGYKIKCADGVWRVLYPIILIMIADYEEQCFMAAIRGLNSKLPCPMCLVPDELLSDVSQTFPPRTTEEMKDIYERSLKMNADDREELLKSYGLRQVENTFWQFQGTDIYAALSFERLHAYHAGLFEDHLWTEFKAVLNDVGGKEAAKKLDNQFAAVPRWSGLNHFSEVMKMDFADGSKYEDISKILVFAAHNILNAVDTKQGYLLLKILRSYLELDMYASLTVHTEDTITAGRAELQQYNTLLQKYARLYPEKSWNFPKSHSHKHLFDDIEKKGATRNFNSKPNEKRHRPFKKFYLNQSNFKDVDPQLLKLDENSLVALIIRRAIDTLDESEMDKELQPEQPERTRHGSFHVTVGSPLSSTTIEDTEREHSDDLAFKGLRKKLNSSLTRYLGQTVKLNSTHEVVPYQYLKVRYESVVNWETSTDILRVNPSFHGRPRYDYVLLKVSEKDCVFAQLLHVFAINLQDKPYYMALVLPMDVTLPLLNRGRDRDLRFTRVCARPRSGAVIVDTETIIRGALLVEDYGSQFNEERIVMDVVDEDFWLRMKTVSLAHNVKL